MKKRKDNSPSRSTTLLYRSASLLHDSRTHVRLSSFERKPAHVEASRSLPYRSNRTVHNARVIHTTFIQPVWMNSAAPLLMYLNASYFESYLPRSLNATTVRHSIAFAPFMYITQAVSLSLPQMHILQFPLRSPLLTRRLLRRRLLTLTAHPHLLVPSLLHLLLVIIIIALKVRIAEGILFLCLDCCVLLAAMFLQRFP
jgi:hypothetical protein